MKNIADLIFESHGTLVPVLPDSERGGDWLDEHCAEGEDHTYFGEALVVERLVDPPRRGVPPPRARWVPGVEHRQRRR